LKNDETMKARSTPRNSKEWTDYKRVRIPVLI